MANQNNRLKVNSNLAKESVPAEYLKSLRFAYGFSQRDFFSLCNKYKIPKKISEQYYGQIFFSREQVSAMEKGNAILTKEAYEYLVMVLSKEYPRRAKGYDFSKIMTNRIDEYRGYELWEAIKALMEDKSRVFYMFKEGRKLTLTLLGKCVIIKEHEEGDYEGKWLSEDMLTVNGVWQLERFESVTVGQAFEALKEKKAVKRVSLSTRKEEILKPEENVSISVDNLDDFLYYVEV